MMGFGVSTARCKLSQGAMQAEVEIVDNAMAAGMAGMGFAMMPTVDSSDQRVARLNFGAYPGLMTFHKLENKAEQVDKLTTQIKEMENPHVDSHFDDLRYIG